MSLGSTAGLRAADDALAASIERAGASVTVARAAPPRSVRTLALTDYVWARAAREAAREGLRNSPRVVVIYSTTTAALLAPFPGAIRFDALAAGNRPGRHGLWQRPLERHRIAAAPLLIPWSTGSLAGAPAGHAPAVVVPVPVGASGPVTPLAGRDIAAITYAANPHKKGLDRVLEAWGRVRRDGELLLVAGIDEAPEVPGVRAVGRLAPRDYRALLRRARIYLTAPRREDYGIAQLEALADGCLLVTTPAPGPYAALELARSLDPRLVSDDLATAIRAALDDPRPDYAAAAASALERFSIEQVDYIVAQQLLPRLFSAS
ncbi:MAG TPA: glycosyltransferase [Solirubrobacteraceae bacterium]|nr:glycosyltransferase [Solirubrobacteraceae bacterium]